MAEKYRKNNKDLYAALGVPRSADAAQIKKAYRKLAKKYHPDSNKGNAEAEQRFKEISEANAILGDAEKRKIYDEFGYEAFAAGMDPKEYAKRMHEAQKAGFGGFGGGGSGNGSSFHGFEDYFSGTGTDGFGNGDFGGAFTGADGFGNGGFRGAFTGAGGADSGGFRADSSGRRSGFFRNRDGSYTSFHFEGGNGTGGYDSLFEDLLRNGGPGAGYTGAGGPGSREKDPAGDLEQAVPP